MLAVLFSAMAAAQTDSTKRWTKPYRDGYLSGCINSSKAKIPEDSARVYCACLAGKLEALYSEAEMGKLTKEDYAKFELKQMVLRCMNKKWSDTDRANFISNCEKAAAPALGEEKARQYCSCMQQKIEEKFATAAEADLLTKEELAKSEWQVIIKACLQ